MARIILILLLATASSSVMAEWVKIGKSDNGNGTAYFDTLITKTNGSKVRMWTLFDFMIAKTTGGKTYLSMRQQIEFDCKNRKRRFMTYSLYSGNLGNGDIVFEDSTIGSWDVVSSDSIGDTLWKYACGKK